MAACSECDRAPHGFEEVGMREPNEKLCWIVIDVVANSKSSSEGIPSPCDDQL